MYGTVSGITAWVESKNGASPLAAASLAESKRVSGNRGTGLAPGKWFWDGGMMWNGININPSFKLDVEIKELGDNSIVANALDTSLVNGERLPAGGFTGITGTYATVQTGLWTRRSGYHVSQRLCTTEGTCLSQLLIEQNQNKVRMYGTVSGITAWVESKNGASPLAAASLAETKAAGTRVKSKRVSGNRGTGLAPGKWFWDGGMMW